MEILLAVLCGYLLDLLFGDPHWLPHPVQLMGWCISKGEKLLRAACSPKRPKQNCGPDRYWQSVCFCWAFLCRLGFYMPQV